jgi:hypothetical protein
MTAGATWVTASRNRTRLTPPATTEPRCKRRGFAFFSTAVVLASAGFNVVATMRDPGKAGPLRERAEKDGVALDIRQLDVVDQGSIDACIAGVIADHGRIDVLVNNAGSGHMGTIETDSPHPRYATSEFALSVAARKLVDPTGDSLLRHERELTVQPPLPNT